MGWDLMSAVKETLPHEQFGADFAAAAAQFEQHPALKFHVCQERARSLFLAGRTKKARRIVKRMLMVQVREGRVPRIEPALRTLFVANDGQQSWETLIRAVGDRMTKSNQFRMAVMFSGQLQSHGDVEAADEIIDKVLSGVRIAQQPDVALLAVDTLRRIDNNSANRVIDQILDVKRLQKSSLLWRYAADVAESAGHKRKALEWLERAVLLEYESQPDIINLQTIRSSYSTLLKKFGEIIDASATLELPPPDELTARIIRAADQWRSIDDNDTQCCRTTARLLRKLNRPDLAWVYLTTPLANHSGESSPWQSLAQELTTAKDYSLADMAWERAFAMERTNPELLVERAKLQKSLGNSGRSRTLLHQVINGEWQPRYSSAIQAAGQLLP